VKETPQPSRPERDNGEEPQTREDKADKISEATERGMSLSDVIDEHPEWTEGLDEYVDRRERHARSAIFHGGLPDSIAAEIGNLVEYDRNHDDFNAPIHLYSLAVTAALQARESGEFEDVVPTFPKHESKVLQDGLDQDVIEKFVVHVAKRLGTMRLYRLKPFTEHEYPQVDISGNMKPESVVTVADDISTMSKNGRRDVSVLLASLITLLKKALEEAVISKEAGGPAELSVDLSDQQIAIRFSHKGGASVSMSQSDGYIEKELLSTLVREGWEFEEKVGEEVAKYVLQPTRK
jgi:hypothetical protein